MNKLFLSILATILLSLSGTSLIWAKAHVPIDLVQICDSRGLVRNINGRRLQREADRGGCRLPACDFDNIFIPRDACDNSDDNGDGFCDDPGSPPDIPANSAINMTSPCSNPY